ncbi:MAG: hypothetical protein ACT4PV_03825 [Planctomycetaceae bacterium]
MMDFGSGTFRSQPYSTGGESAILQVSLAADACADLLVTVETQGPGEPRWDACATLPPMVGPVRFTQWVGNLEALARLRFDVCGPRALAGIRFRIA